MKNVQLRKSLLLLLLSHLGRCMVLGFFAGTASDYNPVEDIINADFSWDPPSWNEALITEEPRLLLTKTWQPTQQPNGSAAAAGAQIPITVFTALSLERLGQLQNLCNSWPGPMVAAVWLPIVLGSESEPVNMDYYIRQLKQFEKQEQGAPAGSKRSGRRRSSRQNGSTGASQQQTVGSSSKKRRKRRDRPDDDNHDRAGKPSPQPSAVESKLKLQQRQLDRLHELMQQLQLAREQPQQYHPAAGNGTGSSRRLLQALRAPPRAAKQKMDEAMAAVDAMILKINEGRKLTADMQFFQAQAARQAAAAGAEHGLTAAARSLINQPTHVAAAAAASGMGHASGSGQASTQGQMDSDNALGGQSGLLKSAFIDRSSYITRRNRQSAHHSVRRVDASTADNAFSESEVLGRLPACHLTVMLFVQVFRDDVAPLFLFPINSLRNYAALMARTPLVSMIDVDLTFNTRFGASLLTNPERVEDIVRDAASGSLLVPPAFEAPLCHQANCRDGLAAARIASYSTKRQLQALLQRGWLDTFHCSKGTHWIVDYKRWFDAPSAYEVRYARGAEPWFIGHKALLPWYDTRFKGYGFNKQLQVLYATGNMRLRLRVLPDAWLIHIPHRHTAVSHAFKAKGLMQAAARGPPVSKYLSWVNNQSILNATTPSGDDLQSTVARRSVAAPWNISLAVASFLLSKHGAWSQQGKTSGTADSSRRSPVMAEAVGVIPKGQGEQATGSDSTAASGLGIWWAWLRGIFRRSTLSDAQHVPHQDRWQPPGDGISQNLPFNQTTQADTSSTEATTASQPATRRAAFELRKATGHAGTSREPEFIGPHSNNQNTQQDAASAATAPLHAPDVTDAHAHKLTHARGLHITTAMKADVRLHELLLDLYARMFSAYTWPIGRALLTFDSNRVPEGEHPHVDQAMKRLGAQLPWWSNYTSRWHMGQPSAVRPPYLDPPAKAPWPRGIVKQLRAKLEMCSLLAPPLHGSQPRE